MVTKQEIVNQLKEIKYPGFDRDIISFGIVSDIELGETTLKVNINLKSQDPKVAAEIKSSIEKVLKKNNPDHTVIADISVNAPQAKTPTAQTNLLQNIKYKIAIASGKEIGRASCRERV